MVQTKAGAGIGAATGLNIGGAIGSSAATAIHKYLSDKNLKKALTDRRLTSYIKKECDKIYKQELHKDKTVSTKVPHNFLASIRRYWHATDEMPFSQSLYNRFLSQYRDKGKILDHKVGEYQIACFYDTDHIESITLLLYNTRKNKIFGKVIPAPKNNGQFYKENIFGGRK